MSGVIDVRAAIAALGRGEVVVLPTDTVYGLAASPSRPEAVRALFTLKGRRATKAIPVLGDGIDALSSVAAFDERAERVARRHWPGPLTLVLRRRASFTSDLGGDDPSTVAVRVPESAVALEVLRATGPLAVTSANRSGSPPATTVGEARTALGKGVGVFVDGGRCAGAPSTVLSLVGRPLVLRPGAVPEEDLRRGLT